MNNNTINHKHKNPICLVSSWNKEYLDKWQNSMSFARLVQTNFEGFVCWFKNNTYKKLIRNDIYVQNQLIHLYFRIIVKLIIILNRYSDEGWWILAVQWYRE